MLAETNQRNDVYSKRDDDYVTIVVSESGLLYGYYIILPTHDAIYHKTFKVRDLIVIVLDFPLRILIVSG